MWTNRVYFKALPPILSIGMLYSSSDRNTHCTVESNKNNDRDTLSVFIQASKAKVLDDMLVKRGIAISNKDSQLRTVCVAQSLSNKDSYVYQPLLGENAAFRLKGLIFTQNGDVVGTGRVSTMMGELKHDNVEACIPLVTSEKIAEKELLDIATRITNSHVTGDKRMWKGRLPPGNVLDRNYSALSGVSFQRLPIEQQVVVSGTLCTNGYVDKDGNCTFDRSTIVPVDTDGDSGTTNHSSSNDSTKNNNSISSSRTTTADDDGETCPLCRYMKAGPCKAEFVAWNACVSAVKTDEELHDCFGVTATMMRCMRLHEHYDIMSAGMDYSVVDAQDAQQKAHNEEQHKVQ